MFVVKFKKKKKKIELLTDLVCRSKYDIVQLNSIQQYKGNTYEFNGKISCSTMNGHLVNLSSAVKFQNFNIPLNQSSFDLFLRTHLLKQIQMTIC